MPLSEVELSELKASTPRYELNVWSKIAFWTPEEIAALSLGYDPTDPNLRSYEGRNWAGRLEELEHRTRATRRAAAAGQISEKCAPDKAIEWMDKYDIVFPDVLKAAVNEYYPVAERERVNAEVTRHLVFLVKKLRAELAKAESELSEPGAEAPTRTLNSYELMIASMAIIGYSYDPSKKQSDVHREISNDIAKIGHDLTPETVRNHIKEICKKLEIFERPNWD